MNQSEGLCRREEMVLAYMDLSLVLDHMSHMGLLGMVGKEAGI